MSLGERAPRAADIFTRFEDKFLVSSGMAGKLLGLLSREAAPSYPLPSTEFCDIESIYLDSDDLALFRLHFLSELDRFKVRLRRYAPNGVPEGDSYYVELKLKRGEVSHKTRFRVGREDSEALLLGKRIELTRGLMDLNPKLGWSELAVRVLELNRVARQWSLRGRCRVTYRRRAFERDGVRITLDEGIRYEALGALPGTLPLEVAMCIPAWPKASGLYLLEVKHESGVPRWLGEFLASQGAGLESFSKYCFIVAQLMAQGAGDAQ